MNHFLKLFEKYRIFVYRINLISHLLQLQTNFHVVVCFHDAKVQLFQFWQRESFTGNVVGSFSTVFVLELAECNIAGICEELSSTIKRMSFFIYWKVLCHRHILTLWTFIKNFRSAEHPKVLCVSSCLRFLARKPIFYQFPRQIIRFPSAFRQLPSK